MITISYYDYDIITRVISIKDLLINSVSKFSLSVGVFIGLIVTGTWGNRSPLTIILLLLLLFPKPDPICLFFVIIDWLDGMVGEVAIGSSLGSLGVVS